MKKQTKKRSLCHSDVERGGRSLQLKTQTTQAVACVPELKTLLFVFATLCLCAYHDFAHAQDMTSQWWESLKKKVESVRGLSFTRQISFRKQTQEGFLQYVKRAVEKQYPGDRLEKTHKLLSFLGLLPAGKPSLKERLFSLYSSQAVAYYDPRQKVIFSLKSPLDLGSSMGGFLSEDTLQEMVFSHELIHALQDQHFGLSRIEDALASYSSDRALAAASVIEGDASFGDLLLVLKPLGFDLSATQNLLEALRDMSSQFGLLSLSAGNFDSGVESSYLVESLTFPYVQGLLFAAGLYQKGGWNAINLAIADPPVSTEMVLHPEKYMEQKDAPVVLNENLFSGITAGTGFQVLDRDVIGEFGVRACLKTFVDRAEAEKAASGWDGDLLMGFEKKQGSPDGVFVIWLTVWDTPEDAREFFSSYRNLLLQKYKGKIQTKRDSVSEYVAETGQSAKTVLRLKNQRVLIVEGAPSKVLEGLNKEKVLSAEF